MGGRRSRKYSKFMDLPVREQQMTYLEVYERMHALKYLTMQELGISNEVVKTWNDDEWFMERKDEIDQREIERVEERLHFLMTQNADMRTSERSVEFYLKNRSEIYKEKQAISKDVTYKMNFGEMEDDEDLEKPEKEGDN